MNSPLAREDAEKHAGARSCSYCNKVFTNYRALGGHLRIHQEGKTLGTLNYLGSSSNSLETTGNPPASLPNSQPNSVPGVNKQTPIYSNEANPTNMTGFACGNPGVAQTQIIMFPIYSYTCGNVATSHPSGLASVGSASTGTNAAMSYAAFASSSNLVGSDFHIDSSLHLGPNEVCQFNTDEFQISPDGLPPTRGDALQNVQGYNIGPPPCSSPDKAGQNDCRCLVTCENGKRSYLADESGKTDVTNASKKPKISPNAREEPEDPMIVRNAHVEFENIGKRELPLFVDFDYSVPAPKACFGAEEGPEDVDLSLHL